MQPSYFFEGLGQRSRPPDQAEFQVHARRLARHLAKLSPAVRDRLLGFIAALTRS